MVYKVRLLPNYTIFLLNFSSSLSIYAMVFTNYELTLSQYI